MKLSDLLDEEFEVETITKKNANICDECGSSNKTTIENEVLCADCHNILDNIDDDIQWQKGNNKETKGYSNVSNILCPQMSTRTYMNGNKISFKLKKIHTWDVPHSEKVNINTYNIYLKYLTIYNKITAIENYKKIYDINKIFRVYLNDKKFKFDPESEYHLKILDRYIEENNLKYSRLNKEIMVNAAKLFGKFNSIKVSRKPIRIGIIAKCFYYAAKDRYFIYPHKLLGKIFYISEKTVSKGNNRINKLVKKYRDLEKCINRWPITLDDYLVNIQDIFPTLTDENVQLLKKKVNRLRGLKIIKIKVSTSILAGILSNCIETYNFKITKEEILNRLYCSKSVRTTCATLLKPYFY